jgi:hypothetical protein
MFTTNAAAPADEPPPRFSEMDRAFTRVENRYNRLCRFRCCCDPEAKPLTPAERVLRLAIYNSAIHITCSGLAFAGWFMNRPRGMWQLMAAILQLIGCVASATAALSLLIVWAPSVLKLVRIMQRTLRVSSAQEAQDFDEAASEFVAVCAPKERLYVHAYSVCCVLGLVAWVAHIPHCVRTATGSEDVCTSISFGFPSAMNVVVAITAPLQVWLCRVYERRIQSQRVRVVAAARVVAMMTDRDGDEPKLQASQSRDLNGFL